MSPDQKPQHSENVRRGDAEEIPASSASGIDLRTPTTGHVAPKKSLAFHLTFIAVLLNLFVYALDATTLAVAAPVSYFGMRGACHPSRISICLGQLPGSLHQTLLLSNVCKKTVIVSLLTAKPAFYQAIAAELEGTSLESFWASISYLLAVAVTQPLYATFSDILGRKSCLFAAYILFSVGSIVFALAHSMSGIITGRVLQGLGGGGLDVLSEILVTDMTTLQERSMYLGLMAIPTALGSVLGPTVGGIFSGLVTWRWLGWINLPFIGVSMTLTALFLRLRSLGQPWLQRLQSFDWFGMSLFTIGIVLFALPLSWAGSLFPWGSFRTLLPFSIGLAILVVFGLYESIPTVPIMPHRIFQSKTASATFIGVFFHGASLYSLLQWLPLLYQAVMSKTLLQSAVTLLPTSAMSVVAAIGGVTIVGLAKSGYRWSIRISWALTAAGTGVLLLLNADSSASMLLGLPVLWGVGIGLLLRLVYLPLQASVVRVDDTGLAIGMLLTFRLLGGLVGLAICSTVFSSNFAPAIEAIADLPASLANLKNPEAAVAFIPQLNTVSLPHHTLVSIRQAYLVSIWKILYTMIGFAGLGLLSSFFVGDLSLQKTDRGQQQFEL